MAGMHTWLLSPSAELNQPRNIHLKTSYVSILPASTFLVSVLPPFHQAVRLYISLFPSLTSSFSSVIRVLLKWAEETD